MSDEQAAPGESASETGQDAPGRPDEAEQASDDQDAASEAQRAAEGADEPDRGAVREAQRLRQRARQAEAERDALRAQVERLQRAEVERLAGESLSVGGDVFTVGGLDLADVLDDGGDVDPAKVAEVAERIAAERPRLAPERGFRHGQGKRGSGTARRTSWQDVLTSR